MDDVPDTDYEPPSIWTAEHVMHRMVEACKIASLLPERDYFALKAAWPTYTYEFEDLVGWQELEQEELAKRQRDVVQTRVHPTAHQISLLDEAIYWPMKYLKHAPGIVLLRWAARRARSRRSGGDQPAVIVYGQAQIVADGLAKEGVAVR
jgi:hypothetical protein